MLSVLLRVFVGEFYRQKAGTLLVIALLAFGFLSAREHIALITAALGSPLLLALVFVGWTFYVGVTASFVRQQLAEPAHLFVQTFRLIPTQTRWLLWLLVQLALLSPILLYGGWMIQLAKGYQKWDSLTAIVLCLTCLLLTGIFLNDHRLRHPYPISLRLPQLSVRLPYVLYFPTYWLQQDPLSLVLTKAFSGLLLIGVCRLYPTDDYDQRLLLIGLLLSVLIHAQVSRQLSEFEHTYLIFLPNMPFSRWQRFGRYLLTYGLMWLSELLILLRNRPTGIALPYVGGLWLAGLGWLLFLHALAYGKPTHPQRWLPGIVAGFIGGLLLIMFGLPMSAWFAVGWAGAVSSWFRREKTIFSS